MKSYEEQVSDQLLGLKTAYRIAVTHQHGKPAIMCFCHLKIAYEIQNEIDRIIKEQEMAFRE